MTDIWTTTLNTDVGSAGGVSIRNALLSPSVGTWKDFRIRVSPATTGPLSIDNASFGLADSALTTVGAPVPVTFNGGSPSLSIAAGGAPVWSDVIPVTLTINAGERLIAHLNVTSGAFSCRQQIGSSVNGFAYKVGDPTGWSTAALSGYTWVPSRSHSVDRVEAVSVGGGGLPLIDEKNITSSVSGVTLVNNTGIAYRETLLHLSHVGSDREVTPLPDSVLVAYCGFDYGATFSKTMHVSSGLVIWPNASAPWPPTNAWPLPAGNKIDPLSTVALGFLLSADSGDSPPNCTSGDAWFTSEGMMNGIATKTNYRAKMHKNGLGLINGVEIPILYDTYGTCGLNPGQIMNAIRIEASGNGPIYNLVQGRVSWYGIR